MVQPAPVWHVMHIKGPIIELTYYASGTSTIIVYFHLTHNVYTFDERVVEFVLASIAFDAPVYNKISITKFRMMKILWNSFKSKQMGK